LLIDVFLTADIANCVERHPAPSVSATKAALHPSVSLRSSRIQQPKQAVATKVAAALSELGISTHLIMPPKLNVERLDSLQAALAQLVDLKKNNDRIEQEIRVVKKRKAGLLGIDDPDVKIEEGEGSTSVRLSFS
jgi:DNA methyltransferase 1-associated protein 1